MTTSGTVSPTLKVPIAMGYVPPELSHPGTKLLIDVRGRKEPAHVVELSLGGMIAFQLAVDHPQCVRTLTIVNSLPALAPRTLS